MISLEAVKRVINTPEWQALKAHILSSVDELDSIADIDFSTKEKATIEGRARQLAAEKLRAILVPFTVPKETGNAAAEVLEKREDAGL